MFTGIIQAVATVAAFKRQGEGARLRVETPWDLADVEIGESIAVSGCCLTVVAIDGRSFEADLSDETLRATALAGLAIGDAVNLERALRFCDRLGGHLVTGHIDTTGHILALNPKSGSLEITISVPQELGKYLINKGSIAVDGISLTLSLDAADLAQNQFRVTIIPHTETKTTLSSKHVGDAVNLEMDYLAKMVERLVGAGKNN